MISSRDDAETTCGEDVWTLECSHCRCHHQSKNCSVLPFLSSSSPLSPQPNCRFLSLPHLVSFDYAISAFDDVKIQTKTRDDATATAALAAINSIECGITAAADEKQSLAGAAPSTGLFVSAFAQISAFPGLPLTYGQF